MRRRLASIALAPIAFALGCGDSGDAEAPRPQPAALPLTYERSGGVAGLSESLRIDPDGSATLELGPPEPRRIEFDLTAEELESLRERIDSAELEQVRSGESGCSDCFVYEIATPRASATYDDAEAGGLAEQAVVPDSVTELAAELGSIVAAHRSG